jgi:hypothetical protein
MHRRRIISQTRFTFVFFFPLMRMGARRCMWRMTNISRSHGWKNRCFMLLNSKSGYEIALGRQNCILPRGKGHLSATHQLSDHWKNSNGHRWCESPVLRACFACCRELAEPERRKVSAVGGLVGERRVQPSKRFLSRHLPPTLYLDQLLLLDDICQLSPIRFTLVLGLAHVGNLIRNLGHVPCVSRPEGRTADKGGVGILEWLRAGDGISG